MGLLQQIHYLDVKTFQWCLKRKHHNTIVMLSHWVSRSADGYLYAFAAVMVCYFARWDILQILALAFTIERVIYFVLKNQLRRNRPPQAIPGYRSAVIPADQFSFPSGHTSAAFLVASIGLAYHPIFLLLFAVWAPLVATSRVMLGVHFPTDTVAGAILGHSVALFTLSIFLS